MITLQHVSLLKPGFRQRAPILLDATVTFGPRERVGILALPGSGKSSLARLFAGIDPPDSGVVSHQGRVSWPIGFAGFLHPYLTVGDNLNIFARLVGAEIDAVRDFCQWFCEIPDLAGQRMRNLSPTQRALLGYACSLSLDGPAIWIADEVISVGESRHRDRCDAVLAERLETGGLIFLSRTPRLLKLYCDRFCVLLNHRLVACDDLQVAHQALLLAATTAPAPTPETRYSHV